MNEKTNKTILFSFLMLCIIFMMGCQYVGIAGGEGGDHSAGNISVEGSLKSFPFESDRWFCAAGFTYIDSDGRERIVISPDPYIVAPGDKRRDEIGGYIKIGPELLSDSGVYGLGILGLTVTEYEDRSGHESHEGEGLLGIGLLYFIHNNDLAVTLDFDNRRGITAGLGLRF